MIACLLLDLFDPDPTSGHADLAVHDGTIDNQRRGLKTMRRLLLPVLCALALASLLAAASTASARGPKILEFESMAPVTGPYVGSANPIRGINGGGVPWKIASAEGELKADGRLEITVTGLVLAAGASNGSNPVPFFRATVSCQSTNSAGTAIVVNRSTDPFEATTGPAARGGGNAHVEARVDLPHPCIAPIIFVNNGTGPAPGAWFAATGAQ